MFIFFRNIHYWRYPLINHPSYQAWWKKKALTTLSNAYKCLVYKQATDRYSEFVFL